MNQMPVRVLPDREARVAEDGAPRHHVSGHEPREPADREQDDRGTMVSVGGEPGTSIPTMKVKNPNPRLGSGRSTATAGRKASIRHTCSTTSTV
jgi:hypothetical protein